MTTSDPVRDPAPLRPAPLRPASLHPIVAQMQPNDAQLAAIVARDSDLLLSAGAGSGKTLTLTARVLSLLAEGIPLRAIVAVTFTIKAASEMRNRLRREIQRYLARAGQSADERKRWRQIALEMDGSRIGTIHSLCSEILRIHAAEAGIDPRFTVLDESAARLRKRVAADALLQGIGDDAQYAPLVETMGLDLLHETLTLLLDDAQRADRLLDPANDVRIGAALAVWAERTRAFMAEPAVLQAIVDVRAGIEEANRSAETGNGAAKNNTAKSIAAKNIAADDALAPYLQPIVDAWERACAALDGDDPLEALAEVSAFAALPKNKGRRDNWIASNPKAAVQTLQSTCAALLPLPEKSDPRADVALLALLPALRTLAARARTAYAESKREVRALDFDDLEAMASTLLLENEAVRSEWQKEVQALLVDEFQDTNGRQRDLLRAIAGERGILFMVGDAKQSIYRFRGADVRVFRTERMTLEAGAGETLALAHSFRAHPQLLDRLNTLLAEVLPPADGDALPTWVEPFAPLVAGRSGDSSPFGAQTTGAPRVEVHLGAGAKNAGAMQVAADALAARLLDLHQAGIPWEAMALLCRRVALFAPYEDAFERFGIPYVTTAGAGFHQRPEVRDLLNALRALADPADNQALAGFLRSPLVGMSDGDLLLLHERIAPPGKHIAVAPGAWWAAVQEFHTDASSRAVTLVRELGGLTGRVPVSAVIAALLERTGYEAALVAAGNQRAARNLAKLLEDAQRTPQASLRSFLSEIREIASAGARIGEARTEAAGSVQIMTIHSAKGLEYPVVVIGDVGGRPPGRQSALLPDESNGLLFPAGEGGTKGILYAQAAEIDRKMEDAETGRLLYVAATRAQELLILSGTARVNAEGIPQPENWLRTLAMTLGLDQPFATATDSLATTDTAPETSSTENTTRNAPTGTLTSRTEERLVALYRQSPEPPASTRILASGTEVVADASPAVASRAVQPIAPHLLPPLPQLQSARVILDDDDVTQSAEEFEETAPREHGILRDSEASRRRTRPFLPTGTLPPSLFQQTVGSLFHSALQWGHAPDQPTFAAWLESALERHAIADAGERTRLANRTRALLERYYSSDLQREVAASNMVMREVEYIALVSPGKGGGGEEEARAAGREATGGGEATHVPPRAQQVNLFEVAPVALSPDRTPPKGRIDLIFRRQSGAWAIVDFKVDQITRVKDTVRHLEARTDYLQQVRSYREAFAALTGQDAEAYLCLLDDHGKLELQLVA